MVLRTSCCGAGGMRGCRYGTAGLAAHTHASLCIDAQVHGEEEAAPAAVPTGKRGGERSRRGARLAAAVGVSQMVLPFWSGATWDKQHGVDVERKR